MDLSVLNDREGFRQRVIDALARAPLDYLEQLRFIEEQKYSPTPWEGAGILLPLYFSDQYVFLLNKRSRRVQQAGDLCAPGGGIHSFWDTLFQKVLRSGLLPWTRGPGFDLAKQRGKEVYKKILFFLGNALRESWEEIRLSPFNVEFLGPLPTYRLQSRRRIIFPAVGKVRQNWQPKLSWEVERIVPIPLQAFFHTENYALYSLEVPENLIAHGIPNPWEFPCLVYREDEEEEILWGATFNVIRSFLRIVFDLPLPSPDGLRVIRKPLVSHYFSGSRES
ncbi:MAG: hypothetical protein HY882_12050 [Deltaproteobacteria bacterium]|nr:hypothetical protein [Deltaproteobacteria bacterium]